jgi:hypothetical protein
MHSDAKSARLKCQQPSLILTSPFLCKHIDFSSGLANSPTCPSLAATRAHLSASTGVGANTMDWVAAFGAALYSRSSGGTPETAQQSKNIFQ